MRSILGNILPAAMVNILHNYGPERLNLLVVSQLFPFYQKLVNRYASIFTGDCCTPEVMWDSDLRAFMVEMIDHHLGDFPSRLRQYTLGSYEYCPIPKIHYGDLEKEIYVHEYYLRYLCDEVRFPEWPIGDPLLLLRVFVLNIDNIATTLSLSNMCRKLSKGGEQKCVKK